MSLWDPQDTVNISPMEGKACPFAKVVASLLGLLVSRLFSYVDYKSNMYPCSNRVITIIDVSYSLFLITYKYD